MKEKIKNISLLMGTVIVLLFVMEGILRVLFPAGKPAELPGATNLGTLQVKSAIPGLFWSGNPGYHSKLYQLNADGFRDDAFKKEKKAGRKRIALIGDSVTFGLGVHKADSIYPAILEEKLKKRGDFEVYNFGVPGYNTWQEFVQLKEIVMPFQPDEVVLGFFFNDADGLTAIATQEGISQFQDPGKTNEKQDLLTMVKRSYVVMSVKNLIEKTGVALFDYYPNYMDLKVRTRKWAEMKDELLAMKKYLDARQIPFTVLVFPVSYQLKNESSSSRAQTDLDSFLAEHKFNAVSLFDTYKSFIEKQGYDFKKLLVKGIPDSHPTPAGHRLAAQALYSHLIQRYNQ